MRYGLLLVFLLSACQTGTEPKAPARDLYKTFGETQSFIREHTKPVILADGPRQVLVAPGLAGRVMISTFDGEKGLALGWIKPEVVSGAMRDEHFVNYGAAERLWLAPEGGQYSTYFAPGTDFSFSNWYVPKEFNEAEFSVVRSTAHEVVMAKELELKNYSSTLFKLSIERTISLLSPEKTAEIAGMPVPGDVRFVAYQSRNVLKNRGDAMTRARGLVAVWILAMFTTEGNVTVMAPYVPDTDGGKGPVVTDYGATGTAFDKTTPDRLKVLASPAVVLFKADANARNKIGLSPQRTRGIMASMDWKREILTIAKTPVVDPQGLYVNGAWEYQTSPYSGDAVNSYNDGPQGAKKEQFGYFYELETLSPAKELKQGEELVHDHITLHFQGPIASLNAIAQKALGVDLTKIERL